MLLFNSAPGEAAPVGSEKPVVGQPVLADDALLTTPVGGLERTNAATRIVPVQGRPFSKALRVTLRSPAAETNATQLTIPTATPVEKGDALLASFSLRGASADGKGRAQMMLLFEGSTDPWAKSVSHAAASPKDPQEWKRVIVPFTAAESYRPGEAMVSLRFAYGPQTVEVGGLEVTNFGKERSVEDLIALAAEKTPLGAARVTVRLSDTRQTLMGFGGNFAQPRYGSTEPMDPVGRYNLEHLRVVHARVAIPLDRWTPEKGVYRDTAQAHAALLQMQEMARRKIPIAAAVWEGPIWMLGGKPEQMGRTLPPELYDECIEAIAQFLVTARDQYQAPVEYFSFNEPDYGVNFKFTPEQMAAFIRQAGPRFAALGLKTKFLVGDTANAKNFPAYARPLLEDASLKPYLGPLAFHSWDALEATDESYTEIAVLGRKYNKPVWCLEAGHDPQLWRKPNPWGTWENALRTALAYEKTLRLTGSSLMDYWTYQNNYPLVSPDGKNPYPVFHVMKQMEEALPPGAKVAATTVSGEALRALASVGPKAGQFSVLVVNPAGAGEATLTGLPRGANVKVFLSDADGQRKAVPGLNRVSRAGELKLALPPRSVVTVLGSR
ncbi:MAG: hypothetical protein KY468_11745 [Armatimonadetes bacterium]|nr:hypothetical protein [Armatimonadota bacterium]